MYYKCGVTVVFGRAKCVACCCEGRWPVTEVWHAGRSTSGSCTSSRCARCWSRRARARTTCAARRGTCSRRSTRRTCCRCRSRAARRRPRTCSGVPRRDRRRTSPPTRRNVSRRR